MSRIIWVLIKNSLHRNINREEVKHREIRNLPDLSIFNLLFVFVLVQRIDEDIMLMKTLTFITLLEMKLPTLTEVKVYNLYSVQTEPKVNEF